MADAWLGDVGIRVTDLERSLQFYRSILELDEIDRGGDEESTYVLLRDRTSGQRLELNWYADSSPFAAPFIPGESLDHFEVRVKSVPEFLERLRTLGIHPATRKLWNNPEAVARLRKDPNSASLMEKDVWTTSKGHRIVYIQDPDGNFLCCYDHPEEPWGGKIPDHY
ncbi:MAG TPA: VOC family protein [Thermoplasmata archaeon]|nr:VOC family protein [Thermoplasmata archaeon]